MNRENAIVYVVYAPNVEYLFDELKKSFGVERALNINTDLYIKTYLKISKYENAIKFIAYSKDFKNPDLRWLSSDEPGFLDVTSKPYNLAFFSICDLAFRTGSTKLIWVNHLAPTISHQDIDKALSMVNDKNIVIGPSKNGSIYLLGFTAPWLKIFDNFYFLSDNIKDEIIDKIKKAKINFSEIDEKFVVKDEESLKLWIESDEYKPSIVESKKEEIKYTHKKKKEMHTTQNLTSAEDTPPNANNNVSK
jgi:hypothetical protein